MQPSTNDFQIPGLLSSDDVLKTRFLSLLIMGEAGTGKTTLACHAPAPLLLIDFDNKGDSGIRFLEKNSPGREKEIRTFKISQNKLIDNPYQSYQKLLSYLESKRSELPFKTIVLDSLTLYMEAMKDHIVKASPGRKRPTLGKFGGLEDFGDLKQHFVSDSNRILSLPCHVIFVSHIKEKVDPKTGSTKQVVQLDGSASDYVPTVFKEVYRAFTKKGPDGKIQRLLQTINDGVYVCRSSNPVNPGVIPMDFKEIMKLCDLKEGE